MSIVVSALGKLFGVPRPKEDYEVDPITAIFRIALLPFLAGVKIGFYNRAIFYSDRTLSAKSYRVVSKDSSNDLAALHNIIMKTLQILPPKDQTPQHLLFTQCKLGLEQLKKTYSSDAEAETLSRILDEDIALIDTELKKTDHVVPPLPTDGMWVKDQIAVMVFQLKEAVTCKNEKAKMKIVEGMEAHLDAKDILYLEKLTPAKAAPAEKAG